MSLRLKCQQMDQTQGAHLEGGLRRFLGVLAVRLPPEALHHSLHNGPRRASTSLKNSVLHSCMLTTTRAGCAAQFVRR